MYGIPAFSWDTYPPVIVDCSQVMRNAMTRSNSIITVMGLAKWFRGDEGCFGCSLLRNLPKLNVGKRLTHLFTYTVIFNVNI